MNVVKHGLCATASALALCASPANAATFTDVLDVPATSTPLAIKALFNGLAQAGNNLVAVGQRGFILTSADGNLWQQSKVPLSSDLVAVHFPTATQGWAVGHDGVILHTRDGGATWERQLDGRGANRIVHDYYKQLAAQAKDDQKLAQILADAQRSFEDGPDKPFLDVWFENARVGYVVGAFNLILRTEDGGQTWTPWFDRVDNPKKLHLYAIHSIGNDVYAVGEQGLVLKLDRSAGRFKQVKTPYSGTFFGVVGKPTAVLAYGLRGNVYRSTDGGANWNKVELGLPVSIVAGTVTPDGRIVLVSQAGHVMVSNDDGASVTPARGVGQLPASAVVASPAGDVVIAGSRGMRSVPLQ